MSIKKIHKKSVYIILSVLLLAIVAVCCNYNANPTKPKSYETNSNGILQKIAYWYLSDPSKSLAMLDSAESHKLLPLPEIHNLRAMSYQYGLHDYDRALACAKQGYNVAVEQHDTIGMLRSMRVLASLAYDNSHYTDVIIYSTRAMPIADQVADQESKAFFLMALGSAKSEIDNVDDAIRFLNQSIDIYEQLVSDTCYWISCDNMLYALTKKIRILANNNRQAQAVDLIPYGNEIFQKLQSFGDVAHGLIDIRHAELVAASMMAYNANGDNELAQQCYTELSHTDYAHTANGIDLAVPYLVASAQYEKALRCIKIKKQFMQQHDMTITYYYIKLLLRNEFLCYLNLGMNREAAICANENMIMADSLRTREKKDYVGEVKKLFAGKDMEVKMLEHEQNTKYFQMLIAMSLLVMLTLIVMLVISIRYNRILRKKDRANLSTMEDLRRLNSQLTHKHADIIKPENMNPDDEEQKLFVFICNEIISRKLYLQHGFCREDAISLFPVGIKQFSAMFQKYSSGFTSFINNLRLDYSLEVMRTNTDYTIEGVALDSGFANRQTYHRLFVDKYGMTPMEYKRLLNKEGLSEK